MLMTSNEKQQLVCRTTAADLEIFYCGMPTNGQATERPQDFPAMTRNVKQAGCLQTGLTGSILQLHG